jgi:maltodextrin utilization protein YvdJ
MASSYLDLLSEDLITKIFEILANTIDKEIIAVEITMCDIEDSIVGNDINDKWHPTFKMPILVFIILVFSYLIFLNIIFLSIICPI